MIILMIINHSTTHNDNKPFSQRQAGPTKDIAPPAVLVDGLNKK